MSTVCRHLSFSRVSALVALISFLLANCATGKSSGCNRDGTDLPTGPDWVGPVRSTIADGWRNAAEGWAGSDAVLERVNRPMLWRSA